MGYMSRVRGDYNRTRSHLQLAPYLYEHLSKGTMYTLVSVVTTAELLEDCTCVGSERGMCEL